MFFDLEALPHRESYRLLVSTVVPRPIALVTTRSAAGVVNAAPFSFFNVMGHDPPILVLGIERHETKGSKDTAANILDTHEFVVNLVSEAIAERMNVCAFDFGREVDELAEAGLTPAPSTKVAVPRVLESPASLECRERMTIPIGEGRSLVVGSIVALHIQDEYFDVASAHVRTTAMGLIGRMHGGGWYARTTDLFRMERLAEAPVRADDPTA